MHLIASI